MVFLTQAGSLRHWVLLTVWLRLASYIFATDVDSAKLDACPGYNAQNVKTNGGSLTADLMLAGQACNMFGNDLPALSLRVDYETKDRIHLKIVDANSKRYEVPEEVFPRPSSHMVSPGSAAIQFNYTTSPFTFSIYRTSTKEVLFSTASHPIIFEPQYLRIKTNLPDNPNIYGFGEHTHPFHLPTKNTTLTLWSRDSPGIPTGTNLYGNHPIYFEHRTTGTHGVFFLNSNGMDIKLSNMGGSSLEYNAIGGVLDFYFLAGSESDPTEVARQYAEIVGLPAEVAYWTFGLHQCRWNYKDFVDVAGVISKYAAAGIPLETMWTDIDYMDRRRVFTTDPQYFPMKRMREIVDYLHSHDQRYILMTDPAVAYLPDDADYGPFHRGKELNAYLKAENGSDYISIVWPGVTVYPDWFNPNTTKYWNNEFKIFYNPDTGIDIDGAWIDMNEPSNFCILPCDDPFQQARDQNLPPPRSTSPPDPNTPIFQNNSQSRLTKRDDVLNPPYAINNAVGPLSVKTAMTNTVHANGMMEYDVHNLFGTMMSIATRAALLARRPGKRPLIITRSTFAGAGAHVGKWLGDNLSIWEQYRFSIAGMLNFATIFQVPMVGSDICGFSGNTTETLCARWAMLGAFYPFMRNHNADSSISQEYYIWPLVTQAAKNAIDIRYRLLDYFYTAFHHAHTDGTPVLHPLWFKYPKDTNTYSMDLQFFFGDSILVSPVTEENSTSVDIYLPHDIFYDFKTMAPVMGSGSTVTLSNVDFTTIPVHIKGGVVLPLRMESAMTTTELRKKDFEFVVAPGMDGTASGSLYVDDGESIEQSRMTNVNMSFKGGKLDVKGTYDFPTGVNVARVRFLNVQNAPKTVKVNGKRVGSTGFEYDAMNKVLDVMVGVAFDRDLFVELS